MKWTWQADQTLLLAILHTHRLTVDHARVARVMGCTPRACEERLKKLRKRAKEDGVNLTTPGGGRIALPPGGGSSSSFEPVNYPPPPPLPPARVEDSDAPLIEGRTKRRRARGDSGGIKNETNSAEPPETKKGRKRGSIFSKRRDEGYAQTAAGVLLPLGVELAVSEYPLTVGGGGWGDVAAEWQDIGAEEEALGDVVAWEEQQQTVGMEVECPVWDGEQKMEDHGTDQVAVRVSMIPTEDLEGGGGSGMIVEDA